MIYHKYILYSKNDIDHAQNYGQVWVVIILEYQGIYLDMEIKFRWYALLIKSLQQLGQVPLVELTQSSEHNYAY